MSIVVSATLILAFIAFTAAVVTNVLHGRFVRQTNLNLDVLAEANNDQSQMILRLSKDLQESVRAGLELCDAVIAHDKRVYALEHSARKKVPSSR